MNIRKAGELLRGFDDAYAEKVRSLIHPNPGDGNMPRAMASHLLGGTPIGIPKVEYSPDDTLMTKIVGNAIGYGMPAMSGVVRYGLPAAGLTASGMAVASIANQMSNQYQEADYPEPNQVPFI